MSESRMEPLVRPGVYHFQQLVGQWPTRFHLRVDPDGGGLLMANAAEGVALSQTGALMAHGLLEGRGEAAIITDVRRAFRGASHQQVTEDLQRIKGLIEGLAAPGDNYPISNLGDLGMSDWERELGAPLRADIVQGDSATARQILHALWEVGVPHAVFLATADGDEAQLPLLVEAAEDIGMIAGIRGVASWLTAEAVDAAAMAGMDHLDLLYVSNLAAVHDEIAGVGDHALVLERFEQARALELCPVAQVPLLESNAAVVDDLARALAELEIRNVVFYALACLDDDARAAAAGALPAGALPQVATVIEETSDDTLGRYLWAPPVRFDNSRSLSDQVMAGPRTAGDVTVRIEADGSVFPPRGKKECAGNLLSDPWEMIWGNECFSRYRERLQAPTRCRDCPDLQICDADCPKDPAGWSDDSEGGEQQ